MKVPHRLSGPVQTAMITAEPRIGRQVMCCRGTSENHKRVKLFIKVEVLVFGIFIQCQRDFRHNELDSQFIRLKRFCQLISRYLMYLRASIQNCHVIISHFKTFTLKESKHLGSAVDYEYRLHLHRKEDLILLNSRRLMN